MAYVTTPFLRLSSLRAPRPWSWAATHPRCPYRSSLRADGNGPRRHRVVVVVAAAAAHPAPPSALPPVITSTAATTTTTTSPVSTSSTTSNYSPPLATHATSTASVPPIPDNVHVVPHGDDATASTPVTSKLANIDRFPVPPPPPQSTSLPAGTNIPPQQPCIPPPLAQTLLDPAATPQLATVDQSYPPPSSLESSLITLPDLAPPTPTTLLDFVWPRALVVLVAALWGTNFACVKLIGETMTPADGSLARFALAALSLAPALLVGPKIAAAAAPSVKHPDLGPTTNSSTPHQQVLQTGQSPQRWTQQHQQLAQPDPLVQQTTRQRRAQALPADVLVDGLRTGFWVFLGYLSQSIALQTIPAGKSAFICSLAVVFVPFVTTVFEKVCAEPHAKNTGKKHAKPSWFAAFLAATGVGLMELGGSAELQHHAQPMLHLLQTGDLWAIAQMVGFSMGFIESERALSRHPRYALQITAVQLAYVAMASLLWALVDASAHAHAWTAPNLSAVLGSHASAPVMAAVAFTGLITTSLTIVMENIALAHVTASELSIILSTEPLFATAFAAFLLHETVGREAAVGGGLIMLACLVNQLRVTELRPVLADGMERLLQLLNGRRSGLK